jgi:hypothetical protein
MDANLDPKVRQQPAPTWPRPQILHMEKLKALWRGYLSIVDAFWNWAVLYGLVVNVTASILSVVLIMNDMPVPALLVGYGLSAPYNIVAVVGVWRSAARHDGSAIHADLARGASVILMTLLSVT